jgi:hypothetical protein
MVGSTVDRRALLDLIRTAFQEVALDGGVTLREADVIDSYGSPEERAAARALDFKGAWWAIPVDDLVRYTSVFIFMDDRGIRYYLPRYMTQGVQDSDTELGVFAWLTLEALESLQRFERLPEFSVEQCRAILAFVEFAEEVDPERTANDPCFREDYLRMWMYWAQRASGESSTST